MLLIPLLFVVSGKINFEIANDAGADIIDAASKLLADAPKLLQANSTDPATEAKPAVMMACNSDSVTPASSG